MEIQVSNDGINWIVFDYKRNLMDYRYIRIYNIIEDKYSKIRKINKQ